MIPSPPFASAWMPLFGQLAIVLAVLAAIVALPPAHGRMLLVPLNGAAAARLPTLALRPGTQLLGRGPFAGSLVVWGNRDGVAPALLGAGIITVAAPAALCGPPADGEEA